MRTIPLAVRLEGESCLCVGGGTVAARRVPLLIEAGAAVTVVAPDLDPTLRTLVAGGKCAYRARSFMTKDCLGMFLVLVATGLPDVDAGAAAEARAHGALVCAASDPSLGNCLFMATVRRGRLVVAMHTDGAAPAVAAALRKRIDAQLPDRLGEVLDTLAELRGRLRKDVGDPAERARRWQVVLESGALERILADADFSALEEVRQLLMGSGEDALAQSEGSAIDEQSEYI